MRFMSTSLRYAAMFQYIPRPGIGADSRVEAVRVAVLLHASVGQAHN